MRFQQTLFNIFYLFVFYLGTGCSQSESLIALSRPHELNITGFESSEYFVHERVFSWSCDFASGCDYRVQFTNANNFEFSNESFESSNTYSIDAAMTEQVYYMYLQAKDQQNVYSSVLKIKVTVDHTVPTFTVNNPLTNSGNVTVGNVSAFTISGNCSDNQRSLQITGAINDTVVCLSGAWSKNFNFSSVADGTINLNLNYSDAAGNAATQQIVTLNKSTFVPPASTPTPTPTPTPAPNSSFTATISGEPNSPSNATILNITVAGASIVEYFYKVGISITTDCTSALNYSAAIPVATKITTDISQMLDGPMKVCVLGKDNVGLTQSLSTPTEVAWVKDRTGPTAPAEFSLGAVPSSNNLTPIFGWSQNSTDTYSNVASYQAQVYNASDNSVLQSWTTISNNSALSLPTQNPLMMGNSYYIKVRSIDSLGNIGSASASSSNWLAATLSVGAIGGLSIPIDAKEVHCSASPGKFYAYGGIDEYYTTWKTVNHLSTNGVFSLVSSVPAALSGAGERMGASMVWVPNQNKYFIFGGFTPGWSMKDDVNLYNPTTDVWSLGTPFLTDIPLDVSQTYIPSNATAVAAGNKVYIWNTVDEFSDSVSDLYLYDFDGAPKKWKKLNSAPANLAGHSGVFAFGDGKLVVMRSYQDGSFQWHMATGVYDTATDVWSVMDLNQADAPPVSVNFDIVIDEAHHKLFMFGGFLPECNTFDCIPYAEAYSKYNSYNYSYDLQTGLWSKISNVNQPSLRSEHSAVWV